MIHVINKKKTRQLDYRIIYVHTLYEILLIRETLIFCLQFSAQLDILLTSKSYVNLGISYVRT